MAGGARICLGQIGAAHGVRGEVRLYSFTAEPEAIAGYGPLETEDGGVVQIESLRRAKDHFVAKLAGIADRSAAERLTNVKLYVLRERLPAPDQPDEFYHADLIGLRAMTREGEDLGRIVALRNFGAGDILEIAPKAGGETVLLPFTKAVAPEIDIAGGRIVIAPPRVIEGEAGGER
jgi:16S rRNA processing protein RimM